MRKYSGEQELIWGDNHCEHQWQLEDKQTGQKHWNQGGQVIPNENRTIHNGGIIQTGFCSLCGAWKGAYGLEPTPEMYIEHTIEILREIRRVLRKDGVVFWNIGDSYAGSATVGRNDLERKYPTAIGKGIDGFQGKRQLGYGTKPRDLCLIPFRVAIAAQEDGWWVRSIIIWSKPNPMPESVTDRPTESHEYILMLTKSAKYYWDADAVREPHTNPYTLDCIEKASQRPMTNPFSKQERYEENQHGVSRGELGSMINPAGRNIRSVWEFPTQPYPEAHFAVFPEKLPEICIKAATPEVGCCSKCGAPWERITKPTKEYAEVLAKSKGDDWFPRVSHNGYGQSRHSTNESAQYETLGWQPTCKCNELQYESKYQEDSTGLTPQGFHRTASIERERRQSRIDARRLFPNDPKAQKEYIQKIHDHGGIKKTSTIGQQPTCKCNADKVPSIVLDPFAGAGTTLWVAKKLNRRAVGYEISKEYCDLALERNRQQVLCWEVRGNGDEMHKHIVPKC